MLVWTFFIFSISAFAVSPDFFDTQFSNYLDGPEQVGSQILFSNRDRIMRIDGVKISVVHRNRKSRFSGSTKSASGDLYFSDYKTHSIWRLSNSKMSLYYHSLKMSQPNDIAIDNNNTIYAVDPEIRGKGGNIWVIDQASSGQSGQIKRIAKPGFLTAVSIDNKNKVLIVGASKPCFVEALDLKGNFKSLWKKTCNKRWSIDGMQVKDNQLLVARPGLGRVDTLDVLTGKPLSSLCVLNRGLGSTAQIKSLDDDHPGCVVPTKYMQGLYPTDLVLTSAGKVALTFLGDRSSRQPKDQGFVRLIPWP